MTSCFTNPLKKGIIREWLSGKNRDIIAQENGVSTGTVSNIVGEWKRDVGSFEIDEVREFATTLRSVGLTPLQCARGFRILNILYYLGHSEDEVEHFVHNIYKTCKIICLLPDKIAAHIKELLSLTEKVPVSQLSDHIQANKTMLEESEQELKNVTVQLKETQSKLDDVFAKYTSSLSDARYVYWLKKEISDLGLEFNGITAFVNTVKDIQTLGFDAKNIISKCSEIKDLEARINTLKIMISEIQRDKTKEAVRLDMLKRISATHTQTIYVYEQLATMGLRLPELTTLVTTITEIARENGVSELMVVEKLMDDITKHYKFIIGFEGRIEELKNKAEDAGFDLAILRDSGSELDEEMGSLGKLWAMGIKTETIAELARVLGNENTDNLDLYVKNINYENLLSDLKKYRSLNIVIENMTRNKEELIRELACLASIKQLLAQSIVPSTFRVFHYLNFMNGIIKFARIQMQVHNLYLICYKLQTAHEKIQELSEEKQSMRSDNYEKFLPLINSAQDDIIEFDKLKTAIIDAIKIGLDKLGSDNGQKRDIDKNITNTKFALNQAKIALEQLQI